MERKQYLTVADVAAKFETPASTVYDWVRRGWLQSIRLGGQIRIPAAFVADFETRAAEHDTKVQVVTVRGMKSAAVRDLQARRELMERHGKTGGKK